MSAQYLHLDAQLVKAEIAKLIAAYPDLAEDETLRLDMIDGQTNAVTIIERALAERREAETLAGAIKARVVELSVREGRFVRKSEAMRLLIKGVMQAAALEKLTLAEATISITKPRQSVEVAVDQLGQGFFRLKREADMEAIKTALKGGAEVPGAQVVTGQPGLTIRTK